MLSYVQNKCLSACKVILYQSPPEPKTVQTKPGSNNIILENYKLLLTTSNPIKERKGTKYKLYK